MRGGEESSSGTAYLIFGVALEQENVHHGELVGESVALKLLTYPGAEDGHGQGDVVHRLDLRRLFPILLN